MPSLSFYWFTLLPSHGVPTALGHLNTDPKIKIFIPVKLPFMNYKMILLLLSAVVGAIIGGSNLLIVICHSANI